MLTLSEIEPQFHELKARDPEQILLFRDGGSFVAIHDDARFLMMQVLTNPILVRLGEDTVHFEEVYLEQVLSLIVESGRHAAVLERVVERAPKNAKPERIVMKGE